MNRGQSLVEVIVAVGIVILLVTGLLVGTTNAIRSSQFSTMKSRATRYSQEGLEITRNLRDTSWVSFSAKSGPWCLSEDGTWTQGNPTCPVNIANRFTRTMTFTWDAGNNRMKVDSLVSWKDGVAVHTSQIITYFTQWK